jgi:hypothetical protein
MINVDAMMILVQGGDPAVVGLDADVDSGDPYERLFGLRQKVITERTDAAMSELFEHLREEFCDIPDADSRERAQQLVYGVIANPREIDDLNESELYAVHDPLVNVGVMRTLLYSYDFQPSDDDGQMMDWYVRFHYYMVV